MASETMDAGISMYPWDVVGDPAAADRVAALGVGHATVAAFCHAPRALTPRHPGHRVVVAERSAAYLCFCPACGAAYREAGLDPSQLRSAVRQRRDSTFEGRNPDPEGLARVISGVRAAGAAGVRIYHAGLAGVDDLTAIGKALADA